MAKSSIEWTDATWNPVAGCSKVSSGCKHCYAERMAKRCLAMGQEKYAGTVDSQGRWTGRVNFDAAALMAPLRWKRPRMVFVNSMSDLFHEEVSFEQIAAIFGVMSACSQHTFQVLTKRPVRALEFFAWVQKRELDGRELFPYDSAEWRIWQMLRATAGRYGSMPAHHGGAWPLPNVWLGVSVENQEQADKRVPTLLECPAAVRFLSCEPLLGAVDITRFTACPICHGHSIGDECDCDPTRPQKDYGVDWVICGGESGAKARPMHPDWARGLRDQCQAAEVPFFFKQWGEFAPWRHLSTGMTLRVALHAAKDHCDSGRWRWMDRDGCSYWAIGDGDREAMVRVGKKSAGRLLDGSQWNELPEVAK